MVRISKTLVAGISALAMAAAVVLPTTWRLAARRRWFPRRRLSRRLDGGDWGGRGVWHGGYWRGGYWYSGWWGPAIAAGVLAGAAIASYPLLGRRLRGWRVWLRRRLLAGSADL